MRCVKRMWGVAAVLAMTQLSCSGDLPDAPAGRAQVPWRVQNRIPVTTAGLKDVWASSPTDVFAVGSWGEMLHFDGEAWDLMLPGYSYDFERVWGSGPGDVYVLGRDTHGSGRGVVHFDGSAWRPVELEGSAWWYGSVWGSGRDDVYIGGPANTLQHFDGVEWKIVDPGNSQAIVDISGSGPEDVYLLDSQASVYHFDGSEWDAVEVGVDFGAEAPRQIEVQSAESVLIGGRRSAFYDGSAWRAVDEIYDASFTMEDMCAAGTQEYLAVGGTKVLYFETLPTPAWHLAAAQEEGIFRHTRFLGVWSQYLADGLYAVDDWGGVWRAGPTGLECLNQSLESVNGIGGTSEEDVYAVGDHGSVMHFDGEGWSRVSGFANVELTAVWAWSENNVLLTTASTDAYRFDGVRWEVSDGPPTVRADEIWGFGGGAAVVVGAGGVAAFDGNDWREWGLSVYLSGVWGSSPDDVWAVGSGTILHFDGRGWKVEDFGGERPGLLDVLGFGPHSVYGLSSNSIYHYDGFRWRLLLTEPHASPFRKLAGASQRDLYILAYEGVYHYDGATLTLQHETLRRERTFTSLQAIWSASSTDVFAGGQRGYLIRYGTN
jgi:hypothetical protein